MGAARITKPEIKRAIEAAKECGVKSGAVVCNGIRVEFDLTRNSKTKPANLWDEKLGLNTTE